MLQGLLVMNTHSNIPAFYYLHDARHEVGADSLGYLNLNDAGQHLHPNGLGFFLTDNVQAFAASIVALENATDWVLWDFFHFHWYYFLYNINNFNFFFI